MVDSENVKVETPKPEHASKKDIAESKKEIKHAIHGSKEVIATANTVFPLTLFPDTITIDRTKITITQRQFFQVAEVNSMRIEDLLNSSANIGPFFGSLKIVSRILNPEKPFVINWLWRDDAMKLRRILQGFVIAMQQNIDLDPLSTKELSELLNQLGEDKHPETGHPS